MPKPRPAARRPQAVTGTGNSRVTFLIELAAIIFYCIYIYLVLEI